MPLIQTAAPASEPVSLPEAKNHARVDVDLTDDDTLISLLIGAARRYAESYTGRSFVTQSWKLVLDSFPGPSLMGVRYGQTYSMPDHAILLDKGDVSAITNIQYLDMAGAVQTVAPSTYVADLSGNPARITPVFGQIWPINMPQIGSVWVNYVAGYGAASSVPEGIRNWILIRVNTLYENREEVVMVGGRGKIEPLPFIDSLLDPYKIVLA